MLCSTCSTDQQPLYKIPVNYKYPNSRKTYMDSHIIDTPLSVVERPDEVELVFLEGVQFCKSCFEMCVHDHSADIKYRFVLPLIQKHTMEKIRVIEIDTDNKMEPVSPTIPIPRACTCTDDKMCKSCIDIQIEESEMELINDLFG